MKGGVGIVKGRQPLTGFKVEALFFICIVLVVYFYTFFFGAQPPTAPRAKPEGHTLAGRGYFED